eukprot:6178457-Pleurochrysis_carterae.AAC.2
MRESIWRNSRFLKQVLLVLHNSARRASNPPQSSLCDRMQMPKIWRMMIAATTASPPSPPRRCHRAAARGSCSSNGGAGNARWRLGAA